MYSSKLKSLTIFYFIVKRNSAQGIKEEFRRQTDKI